MCEACDHDERTALEQDIRSGLSPAPIARKYGLRHHAIVIQHQRRHMLDIHAALRPVQYEPEPRDADIELAQVDADEMPRVLDRVDSEESGETALEALKQALPHVRRAVQLAGTDRHEQEQIVRTLNDVLQMTHELLQSDTMGLP